MSINKFQKCTEKMLSLIYWRSTINKYMLLSGFLCLILLPTLFFGHPGKEYKILQENRQLAEFPRASMFFFQRLENWYTDHFGGRATLIYYGARWQMNWIGLPGNRNVILGRNGWLFYDQFYQPGRTLFSDFQGKIRFSETKLKQIIENLKKTQHAMKDCGIDFYFIMPPDKQTIYPDMMPFSRPNQTQTRADQLFSALRTEATLHSIDLRPILWDARINDELPLYLKTDTHWNNLGAYVAVNAFIKELNKNSIKEYYMPSREAYDIKVIPYSGGDIAVSLLSLPNYFKDEKIEMILSNNSSEIIDPTQRRHRNQNQSRRLLLYGDSFSELMLPFLSQSFGEVIGIRKAKIDGADIQNYRPDVVVIEVLERLLDGLEATPINLQNSCLPS